MKALLIVLMLGSMSCSALQKLADTMENVGVRYDRLEKRYDAITGTVTKGLDMAKTAMAVAKDVSIQADKDKDGRVTLSELLAWITGGGGLATIALLLRNGKSNDRKTKMEAALAELQRNAPAPPAAA